jgi:uncharacterized alkaline shock family protein YloU
MAEKKNIVTNKFDTKEFELPETLFVRDIENRVLQGIVLQTLAQIEGIGLVEGTFIDTIFNRSSDENVTGIQAEQDSKSQCVKIKVEVNVAYGLPIPEKAEEIQTKISEQITQLTGLHVACIHVVFKNIIPQDRLKKIIKGLEPTSEAPSIVEMNPEDEYNDEF